MNPMIIFTDGYFDETLSDYCALPNSLQWDWAKGVSLKIPKKTVISTPIYLKFFNQQKNSTLNNRIQIDEESEVTLIEEYALSDASPYTTDTKTTLHIGAHARVNYFKIQNENLTATHRNELWINLKKSSQCKLFLIDCGSLNATCNIRVNLQEPDASCHLRGLYFLNHDYQKIENVIQVHHAAPFSVSDMLVKGILDKQSKASFHGKVTIEKNTPHISAHQSNHNLLLSHKAEVYTQPHLEVYSDDVKCTHGTTVGQLDPQSLFYLRSRGIEKKEALKLLTQAFAAEIMHHIPDATIQQYIQERVSGHEIV